MTDQRELSEALGLAYEHIRALHATLAAVMIDVAALRVKTAHRQRSVQVDANEVIEQCILKRCDQVIDLGAY